MIRLEIPSRQGRAILRSEILNEPDLPARHLMLRYNLLRCNLVIGVLVLSVTPAMAGSNIHVTSDVAARVFLGDEEVGTTPISLTNLSPGIHTIRIQDSATSVSVTRSVVIPRSVSVEKTLHIPIQSAEQPAISPYETGAATPNRGYVPSASAYTPAPPVYTPSAYDYTPSAYGYTPAAYGCTPPPAVTYVPPAVVYTPPVYASPYPYSGYSPVYSSCTPSYGYSRPYYSRSSSFSNVIFPLAIAAALTSRGGGHGRHGSGGHGFGGHGFGGRR